MTTRKDFLKKCFTGAIGSTLANNCFPISTSLLSMRNMQLDNEDFVVPVASDYVQDGLVAMWDGIENVGWNERDENSTKWVDLCQPSKSGFAIQAGKSWWGEASFEFNESYGERIGGYRFPSDLANNGCSYEVCLRIDNVTNDAAIIFSCGGQGSNNLCLTYNKPWGQKYNFCACPYYQSSYPCYDPYFVGSRSIRTFSNSSTSSIQTMYKDGSIVNSRSDSSPQYNGAYSCTLNANYAGSLQGITGGIHSIRVYDRSLSPEEIHYNWLIDKARFGL